MSNESSRVAVDESTGRVDPLAGLALGRIVHYVLNGHVRPAIVVTVFTGGGCDLHVFLNSQLDANEASWRPWVPYNENADVWNTWHWPPRA